MIEKGGHYGPHYATPAGGRIRADLWRLSGLEEGPEGRRRVVPGMPVDNHAMGWQVPAKPGNKKNARG